MAFTDELERKDVNDFRNAQAQRALFYVIGDDGVSYVPVTAAMLAGGGQGGGGSTPALVPLGNHITLALDGTAQDVDWPDGTLGAEIGISGGSARVAVTAPDPTSTTGRLWADGSSWKLNLGDIAGFRAIAASGAPVLDIQPLGAG